MRRALAVVAVVAAAGALAALLAGVSCSRGFGGQDSGGAELILVGSSVKVRPSDRPPGAREAEIFAARNEFESFQVVIRAGSRPLRRVSVSLAEPLARGPRRLPARAVTIYREAYYEVNQPSDSEGAPGPWPDALIPTVDPLFGERRRAFPVDVPAGQNRVAWVDVQVPRDASPGRYEGALGVRAEGLRRRLPVRLTVLRAVLPSTPTLRTAFGMDPGRCLPGGNCSAGAERRRRLAFARTALDNRISISTPYRAPLAGPRAGRDVLALLRGRARTRLPGARLTSLEVEKGPPLRRWRDLLRGARLTARAFVYACDEPNRNPTAWGDCIRTADGAGAVWPEVPVLITASLADASRFGAADLIDTLATSITDLGEGPARTERQQLWLYNSCDSFGCDDGPTTDPWFVGWPGYAIDSPASEARAMGWIAFQHGADGQLHWAVDHRLGSAWEDQLAFGGHGDGTLFYPGTPARVGGRHGVPIESLRLKLIRDGIEDHEYLRLLARRGRGAAAMEIAAALFPSVRQTARSDADVQDARRRLAEHLRDVTGGPRP